jgi:phosphoenolpyruvate carboxykinase (GTP)
VASTGRGHQSALTLDGLDLPSDVLKELITIDDAGWRQEMTEVGEFFKTFGDRMPASLCAEQQRVLKELG